MPRGFRHAALSISCLSPIVSRPPAFVAMKIASLIFRPERRFLPITSFHSLIFPTLSLGSSSLISRRRHFWSLSRARLRPPGNIQSRSRLRLTRSTRPRFIATSFDDFAISLRQSTQRNASVSLPLIKVVAPPPAACRIAENANRGGPGQSVETTVSVSRTLHELSGKYTTPP
jgi:hypothetical protein